MQKKLKKVLTSIVLLNILTVHTLSEKVRLIQCWRSSMAEQLICNQQVAGSNPIASLR